MPTAAAADAGVTTAIAFPGESAEQRALESALALRDEAALAGLVLAAASRTVRQRAAEAIADPARVRDLLRKLRGGGDKSLYKILSAKRDHVQAAERRVQQLRTDAQAVAAGIERHSHRSWDAVYVAQLEHLEKRWTHLADHADPALRERVAAALTLAENVIEQHERAQAIAAGQALAAAHAEEADRERREREKAEAMEAAAERARSGAAERQAAEEQQQAVAAAIERLTATTYRALGALKRGRTALAARLREELREQLSGVTHAPVRLLRQIEKLDESLATIREWRDFSVAPKRAQLLERMERLIDADIAPPELARRIRELQEAWRTLGRGAGDQFAEERERFRELGRRAWEPCQRHFEQQKQLRADNLARRIELSERLEALIAELGWSEPEGARRDSPEPPAGAPDWRRVIRALADANREWRRYTPVARDAAPAAEERFRAAIRILQSRLDAEYERNVRARRAIIERAAQVATRSDTRQAVEEVKALQQRWKAAALVPHEQQDALWREFREHCDAVFQKREQESATYAAELEANRARAMRLCESLDAVCALAPDQLLATGPARLEELRREFESIELPRQTAGGLRQRFSRLASEFAAKLASAETVLEQRKWADLLDAADHVRRFAVSRLTGQSHEACEGLRQAAVSFMATVPRWPRGGKARIEQQLQRAANAEPCERDVSDVSALRELCVRAEVLAEVPTPEADRALRRQYQLSCLVQRLGQGAAPEAADLESLVFQWISAPPAADAAYAALRERFDGCRDRLARAAKRG